MPYNVINDPLTKIKTVTDDVFGVKGNFANKNFASRDLLGSHYEKHAVKNNEFHGAYSNADEYMQGARDVMSSGTKVEYQYKGETRTGT
ncbi:hypothetical protein [Cytobacillus sp. FSL R5-0596]|uniref:hypothetical protein n=1 Tax=Cytobacillus sp. FSL R5-0596 TaxID=2954696 RepID=UPI0030FB9082|nr:hypothetical protein [Cytobacillus firmus]